MKRRSKRPQAPRTNCFSEAQVEAHISKRHPFCPVDVRREIVRRIVRERWSSPRIGRAFGIVSENLVRHEMTDYEGLLKLVWRDQARQAVAPTIQQIIRSWSTLGQEVRAEQTELRIILRLAKSNP